MSSIKSTYAAILLLGVVSLMGDIVYEGSRGLVTPYLRFLGASAFAIAFAGRFGEFLGYALRLVSGKLADTTRAYWFFMFLGYGLISSIPLLGITGIWWIAVILVLLERIGKAIRSPSRDAVLSIVSKGVGAGKAFGIHELLDQVGAILGPLIVAGLMFYTSNNYSLTFVCLSLPFIMLLATLAYTYRKIDWRKTTKPEAESEKSEKEGKLGKPFYIYTFAVLLNTIGLIPFEIILYKATEILEPTEQLWIVPLIYTLIQGVDAPTALIAGFAYDRFKIRVLLLPFILSIIPTLFAMTNANLVMLSAAAVFFGLVLGMQESIYRAAVSGFAPISSRGTAYGIFNTAYGIGMLASGAIYGLMVQLNAPYAIVIPYAIATQVAAIILLLNTYPKTQTK
ncbi:MAG: MFS transporter [Candidatus Bathyarchaeia archaeon]